MAYDHFALPCSRTLALGAPRVAQLIHDLDRITATAGDPPRGQRLACVAYQSSAYTDIQVRSVGPYRHQRLELERVTHHLRAVALAATNAALTMSVEPLTSIANAS